TTLPIVIPRLAVGCPECVHVHWRWGAFFPYRPFGAGYPLLYPQPAAGSNQSLDIAVNRSGNNEDPTNYSEGLGLFVLNTPHQPVLWYSARGKDKNQDTLLWHTGFFYPTDTLTSASVKAFFDLASASTVTFSNGPTTIDLGDVYKAGDSHIEQR